MIFIHRTYILREHLQFLGAFALKRRGQVARVRILLEKLAIAGQYDMDYGWNSLLINGGEGGMNKPTFPFRCHGQRSGGKFVWQHSKHSTLVFAEVSHILPGPTEYMEFPAFLQSEFKHLMGTYRIPFRLTDFTFLGTNWRCVEDDWKRLEMNTTAFWY